jgi:hypothetical protein
VPGDPLLAPHEVGEAGPLRQLVDLRLPGHGRLPLLVPP